MSVHMDRALVLFSQSRHDLAEKELRQELALEPQNAHAHALLGLCLSHRKEYEEATQSVQQAIVSAPDMAFAHYASAQILFDRNRFDESLSAAQEAVRLDPHDADHFALVANIRLQQRRWPDALESAEDGLKLDPEHTGCNNIRAIALVKLGRKAEAGATIDAALSRNPEDALSHANQGWTLLHQGKSEKAMEHFKEALRLEPDMEWARLGIVEALKARHFTYGLMLRYFLWMSKFNRTAGFAIVFGGWIGAQLLIRASRKNPAIAPYTMPIIICYVIFVWMSWLADPLFNLVLRLNRFGRLVLSKEEILASTLVGSCLLASLVSLGLSFQWPDSPLSLSYISFAFLALPTAATFKCAPGWPRWLMGTATVVFLLCGLGALGMWIFTPTTGNVELFKKLVDVALWGPVISTFAAGFLGGVTPKR